MDRKAEAAGLAALAICESLLLSLTESKLLGTGEARSILEDAATANRNAIPLASDGTNHAAAASVIELILAGGNSVRLSSRLMPRIPPAVCNGWKPCRQTRG